MFEIVNLYYYSSYNNILFYKDYLWVLVVAELYIDIIKKSYN